jgi:hypothetical protein
MNRLEHMSIYHQWIMGQKYTLPTVMKINPINGYIWIWLLTQLAQEIDNHDVDWKSNQSTSN